MDMTKRHQLFQELRRIEESYIFSITPEKQARAQEILAELDTMKTDISAVVGHAVVRARRVPTAFGNLANGTLFYLEDGKGNRLQRHLFIKIDKRTSQLVDDPNIRNGGMSPSRTVFEATLDISEV